MEDLIGFVGAFLIQLNIVPQIIKSLKTKKVNDLSIVMIIILIIGSLFWLIYGIIIQSYPIIFSDSIGMLSSLILLIIKIKYDKKWN